MATAAWEIGIFLTTQGLVDGGRAGLLWSVVWNFVGFCPIYLSMVSTIGGKGTGWQLTADLSSLMRHC